MSNSLAMRSAQRSSPATFNFPSSDSSDTEDDAPLPFPTALPRNDFLTPDFDPATYLSALPHRHQTLEDLRSELRERSAAISSELLELVNSNYTTFLSLGSELHGGDEKVEDVKVALLGFRRAVEDVKLKVTQRRTEAENLTGELSSVRTDIEEGRKMVEASERLSTLEQRLSLASVPKDSDVLDSEDETEEDHGEGLPTSSPARLAASATEYRRISALMQTMAPDHPFTSDLSARLTKCRNTLLLDLSNAMKAARKAVPKPQDKVLEYLAIYRKLEAHTEAVKALKS